MNFLVGCGKKKSVLSLLNRLTQLLTNNLMLEISNAEIVQFIANGYTVKEISEETKVSERTLDSRIKQMKEKSSSLSQSHLVAKYFRLQLIK